MAAENDVLAILKVVDPLFKKLPNTLYDIVLVDLEEQRTINVFFEWGRIGHATVSRQVKAVSYRTEEEKVGFWRTLREKTPLPISWQ